MDEPRHGFVDTLNDRSRAYMHLVQPSGNGAIVGLVGMIVERTVGAHLPCSDRGFELDVDCAKLLVKPAQRACVRASSLLVTDER